MTGFYARFVPDHSRCAAVLHALMRKGARFVCTDDYHVAFDSLKQELSKALVLQFPDFSRVCAGH